VRYQIGCQAGEQFLQRLPAAGQQRMCVPALRHAATLCGVVGRFVAVDDGDTVVRFCHHAGGEHARDTGAEYECVVAGWGGHRRSLLFV
jgi:hypothetical protein